MKKSAFDVACKLADGSYVDVEVQLVGNRQYADRCLYYSTFNIQSQVMKGDPYKLNPVYIVSIDAFSREHGEDWNDRILSSYSLREDQNHELMTDNLHFVFVELVYFNKKWEDIDNDKERFYFYALHEDRLRLGIKNKQAFFLLSACTIFVLKQLHRLDYLPEGLAEGMFGKLMEQARYSAMPKEMQERYIRDMFTELDQIAALRSAREEGLKEGIAQGLEKGAEKARLSIARNMKSLGIATDLIVKSTGLTIEQVEALYCKLYFDCTAGLQPGCLLKKIKGVRFGRL